MFNLYASTNRGNHYWYVLEDLTEDYIEQLTDWKANPKVKNGHELKNYISSGNDHYFDCEKMWLVFKDYFRQKILPALARAATKSK